MRTASTVLAALFALLIAAGAYFGLGWNRMTSECGSFEYLSARMPDVPTGGSIGVHFSWRFPDGFTCSYSDGTTRSSLWF